ncbi:hypothetical protein TIFTF001_056299 [Ficus carica]|uniref:Uncharacterized protein n=1 Tax=Ficus carica TaxID=3494 RepID=A0AA88JFM8_FICCA|nr:hypothetical protein TIFTF001_056296 [Ficus carica]GMN75333.1 hypothetical protein TIFTF001_056297 [Ficus carica]GMN75335.1 hypothetical protein TIFTF001_056298 [Ficus carica]GMN75336.1 hypothetical protein TIFTF001_056299 [Ficus carica]
MNSVQLAACH